MNFKNKAQSFHIPVMGLAFTIDSPIRVAGYGIDSVISIMDDDLIEKIRAHYSKKFQKQYEEITIRIEDFRAKRITRYLNLVNEIVNEKYEAFTQELSKNKNSLEDFLNHLPSGSDLKLKLEEAKEAGKAGFEEVKATLHKYFAPGSIDVNIMTKVDKDNFKRGKQLSVEYNDAHAALRGYALSDVSSSIIFSAGMNPRLFSYMETFDCFYPDAKGNFQKKVVLKVSDFRSAMIQGNYLAKKGIWVSEYRVESGLNCGGHAFATDGHLLGPILEEFKTRKSELAQSAFDLLEKALETKGKPCPDQAPELKITVQGGVGTGEEHQFLLDHYEADSVGWGSPFLLVPEATSVDEDTRKLLADAKEEDLYLSDISPLGIPFNTVKGMTNDFYKNQRIEQGKAGSSCPKKYLALSKEYDIEGTCPASKKHQDKKIAELNERVADRKSLSYILEYNKITEKACLCVGLANSAQLDHGIPVKGQKQGVVVCPGPNIAYFSKPEISLKEMMKHIYGIEPLEDHSKRPHFFVKELKMYVDYLKDEINNTLEFTPRQVKKWEKFRNNLKDGINYYRSLFHNITFFNDKLEVILNQFDNYENELESIEIEAHASV